MAKRRSASAAESDYDLLPSDYDYPQMFKDFGPLIRHLINKKNKVNSNAEDAYQELCAQLVDARVIEKWSEQVDDSMPDTLSRDEVIKFLGITEDQWRMAQHHREHEIGNWKLVPVPAAGNPYGTASRYKTTEIVSLSTTGYFKKPGTIGELPAPKRTRLHFQRYLSVAVNNRFWNFCRNERRHHKERVLDVFHEFRQSPNDKDKTRSWDDINGAEFQMSDGCNQELHAELAIIAKRIAKTKLSPHANKLFEMIDDGYTLEEAINKLDAVPREVRRASLVAIRGTVRAFTG